MLPLSFPYALLPFPRFPLGCANGLAIGACPGMLCGLSASLAHDRQLRSNTSAEIPQMTNNTILSRPRKMLFPPIFMITMLHNASNYLTGWLQLTCTLT
jgi:hypothetical protein